MLDESMKMPRRSPAHAHHFGTSSFTPATRSLYQMSAATGHGGVTSLGDSR